MLFAGNHLLTLDEKDRVVFPLALRKCMDEKERDQVLLEEGFMVRPSDTNEFLELYPRSEYEAYINKLEARFEPDDVNGQDYLRFFTSRVEPVDLDRQYRFTVPLASKQIAQLSREVVFIGRTRRIEIWAKERWEEWSAKNSKKPIPQRNQLGPEP